MKERPILMHARSIKGILEGRKVQTRRIIKNPPTGLRDLQSEHARNIRLVDGGIQCDWFAGVYSIPIKCPYGLAGDRLWVRETFYYDLVPTGRLTLSDAKHFCMDDLYYRADGECCDQIPECCCAEIGKPRWRPGIHMPRWASRLTLEIASVRVERIQSISADDCLAEGVQIPVNATSLNPLLCITSRVDSHKLWSDHKNATADDWLTGYFALLWEETNGKGAWQRNDWCWVISFKRLP